MKVIMPLFNLVRCVYMVLAGIVIILFTMFFQIIVTILTFRYHPILHPKIKAVLKEIHDDIFEDMNH